MSFRHSIILFLLPVVIGCGVCKHKPTHSETHIKDSTVVHIKDSLVVRDSVVYVQVPVEQSQNILPTFLPSHLETSVAESDAFVDSLGLHHTLKNKEAELQVHVPVTEHYHENTSLNSSESSTVQTATVEVEKELSWWQKFRLKAFWILLAVSGVFVYSIIKKI